MVLIQPCEIIVRTLIPSVRAAITRELVEKHGLKQVEVAKLLGVTQAAVSQYVRGARGGVFNLSCDDDISSVIRRIAEGLAGGSLSWLDASTLTCEVCYLVRRRGLYRDSRIKLKGKYEQALELICRDYDSVRDSGEGRIPTS
ncbi:MAG: helix-turn-helix domain-containing protein [Candidatus Korarchaeum sp.]|nr:helix-turn-helix domain-containing protein [Candidatus Korarchaeum sp.]MDW8036322.1 helix-turn-helix domain-containing protein [Candidatus Korarchaeum sp.]